MNMLGSEPVLPESISSLAEEVLIKKLQLSHDPDDRQFDSELLLSAVENIMICISAEEVSDLNLVNKMEVYGSEEPLGKILHMISLEVLYKWPDEENLHTRTMLLFDLLGSYGWDAKVVLVIASFVASYGELRLLMQLYSSNPMASSIAMLKKLPADWSPLMPRFKALSLLVNAMVDVTKYIIKFEQLPLSEVEFNHEEKAATKSIIYIASYWIIRSILRCSPQITDSTAMISEQFSDSTIIATWEILSLVHRLRTIYSHLKQQVEFWHHQTERKLYQKLLNVFTEPQLDNQEVLRALFAMRDNLPLKNCSSQAKLCISDLKDKTIVLLLSRPEFLSVDETLLLVQQTHDHPHYKNLEGSFKLVWIPIPVSDQWTTADATSFQYLSNSLPWYSMRKPWRVNSAVVTYIKKAWNYKNEPLTVVLDSQGNVTENTNVLDMLVIWGVHAYPFSASREKELWQKQNWTMQCLVGEIDPRLTKWIEEDRNICMYGSNSINWIVEFCSKMESIKRKGVELEMVYVGKRNSSQQLNMLTMVDSNKLSSLLSFIKARFFWLRLEAIRRSKLGLGKPETTDRVLDEVSTLLDMDDSDKNWAVIGRGSNIVRLEGPELLDEHVAELALLVCGECKQPMKKFAYYN